MSLVPGGPAKTAQLPDLVALYARAVGPVEASSTADLDADMSEADARLAGYRADLQQRVDSVTTQIIVRYHEAPSLALLLLPPLDERLSTVAPGARHDAHDAGHRPGQRAW